MTGEVYTMARGLDTESNAGGRLREGTGSYFIAQHIDKPYAEIVRLAQQHGISITPASIQTQISILKRRGLVHPITTPEGMEEARRLLPVEDLKRMQREGKPKSAEVKGGKAKTKGKTKYEDATDTLPSPVAAKQSALRRLIFEIGYDTAKQVFAEFEGFHNRMK